MNSTIFTFFFASTTLAGHPACDKCRRFAVTDSRSLTMAKLRTKKNSSKGHRKEKDILRRNAAPASKSPLKLKSAFDERSIDDLLTEATTLLEQSQPDGAIPIVEEALRRLEAERQARNQEEYVPAQVTVPAVLVLAGETHMSIGHTLQAQSHFKRATKLDPDGSIVSADPWLWLAQLSDTGGNDSISNYTQAIIILRREVGVLQDQSIRNEDLEDVVQGKRIKLAEALCSMTEVYMTDLSWEPDAEQKCEAFVTEALAVVPEDRSASALQCLANVRISQERYDEAREALRKSLETWSEDEENVPDFASRVSLSRLLMEVSMLEEAMVIVQGLIREDDQSVEAWYLGGWCQILKTSTMESADKTLSVRRGARQWLKTCLKLYDMQIYEDERLQAHARELLTELDHSLGAEADADEDEWEDAASDNGADDSEDLETDMDGVNDIKDDVKMDE